MATLGAVWDGELHEMPVGEQFLDTGASDVIDGWEESDEEEDLDPFESPTLIPVLRSTGSVATSRLPMARTEQAWGSLSVTLQAFARVAEVDVDIYEHVNHQAGTHRFTIKSKEFYSERV